MAEIYHIKDRQADRGRSEGVKVHDNLSLSKHSGSMVSHDQRNRIAREYRFRGTAPATNYCSAIELQDFANRIQEHWRAAHNAQHAPTTARGARHALQTGRCPITPEAPARNIRITIIVASPRVSAGLRKRI
jgi:hypothetical protein